MQHMIFYLHNNANHVERNCVSFSFDSIQRHKQSFFSHSLCFFYLIYFQMYEYSFEKIANVKILNIPQKKILLKFENTSHHSREHATCCICWFCNLVAVATATQTNSVKKSFALIETMHFL